MIIQDVLIIILSIIVFLGQIIYSIKISKLEEKLKNYDSYFLIYKKIVRY